MLSVLVSNKGFVMGHLISGCLLYFVNTLSIQSEEHSFRFLGDNSLSLSYPPYGVRVNVHLTLFRHTAQSVYTCHIGVAKNHGVISYHLIGSFL